MTDTSTVTLGLAIGSLLVPTVTPFLDGKDGPPQ
jgi:hypothetical protein